jgi:chromosome segregation ATPase
MEALVLENEELREIQSQNAKTYGFGPAGPLNAELIAELREKNDILMDENALMAENKVIMSAQLDGIQTELASKTQENGDLSLKLSQMAAEHQHVLARLKQAEHDREEAARHAFDKGEGVSRAEIELEALSDRLAAATHQLREKDIHLQDVKKQLSALIARNEEEGLVSMKRVKKAEDRVRELHGLLSTKTHELDSANDVVRKMRSELQSTRQDAEGMLQVMVGLERKLNDYGARESEVEQLAKDSKEKFEEALTIKEQVRMYAGNQR